MALYFLSYDLRNNRNYEKLYEELKIFNAVKVLESLYCFNRINTSASKLRDYFQNHIDSDDGLIIIEASNWASCNTNGTPNNL